MSDIERRNHEEPTPSGDVEPPPSHVLSPLPSLPGRVLLPDSEAATLRSRTAHRGPSHLPRYPSGLVSRITYSKMSGIERRDDEEPMPEGPTPSGDVEPTPKWRADAKSSPLASPALAGRVLLPDSEAPTLRSRTARRGSSHLPDAKLGAHAPLCTRIPPLGNEELARRAYPLFLPDSRGPSPFDFTGLVNSCLNLCYLHIVAVELPHSGEATCF
ncbi:hypothetical protein DFH08DRAFT_971212 [Mycena albidolilacea]|uniref:Uncharacterized protein n=1 Tax=Mycena albidolilacea TaxID=1033008 RepID=A0AAD7EF24_9AGAR|nr:hypothetical protein DFH08DRAFT_971212 [Mycena albidolilacea]